MQVLLLEESPGAGGSVARELARAGHEVLRCHDPGEPAFPCKGLIDRACCPIDGGAVSVAVDVRASDDVTGDEHVDDGVTCALRRYVPLLLAGNWDDQPLLAMASGTTDGPGTVVDDLERLAAAALPRHSAVAEEALHEVLAKHGLPTSGAAAQVIRRDTGLAVTLWFDGDVPAAVKEVAAVRALGAVNRLDPDASRVSVSTE